MRRGTEVVITGSPGERLGGHKLSRGFESRPLRQSKNLSVGSPADFKRKIDFFVFVLRSKTARSGLFFFLLLKFIFFDSIKMKVIILFTTIISKL